MKFLQAVCSLYFVVSCVNAADPTCSRGIRSGDGKSCCPTYCGACDGAGCDRRPGGFYECCSSGVAQKNRQCSWSDAPCTLAAQAVQSDYGVHREVNIAILPGDPNKDIFSRMRQYGVRVDSILLYQNVQWLSWPYVKSNLDAGLQVQLTLEFFDSYPNLWDIAGGRYDSQLTNFFNQAKWDGRRISVRLLHEFNGDWYNWCALRGGSNSFDAYKAAFRRVSVVIRRTGANVAIMMQYNSLSAQGNQTPFAQMYPGDEFVDAVLVSAYNFCGISNWNNKPIGDVISPWYNAMTAITSKPLGIAEMSSTAHCGGKEQWLRSTWNALAYQFPRIKTVTWFLQNKWSINEDLDLNGWSQIQAWKDGMLIFKNAVGYTAGDQVQASPDQEVSIIKAREAYEAELLKRGLNITTALNITRIVAAEKTKLNTKVPKRSGDDNSADEGVSLDEYTHDGYR